MPISQFQSQPLSGESRASFRKADEAITRVPRRKTRIVMIGMHLAKTRGGITTLTSDILRSRLKDEYQLTYIESQAEDLGKAGKLMLAIRALWKFLALAVRGTDVVYVHVGSNASLYRESCFLFLSRMLGRKTICHFHAGDAREYLDQQPRLCKRMVGWVLGLSDLIIGVSAKSSADIRYFVPGANIVVLPNAIDMEWFEDEMVSKTQHDSTPQILFVGAIGKLKGERDLIAALRLLKQKGVEVRASILGYGADGLSSSFADAGVADMIDYSGPVPMAERVRFFKKANIFVLPTYAEAMPISVMEAMAAGLAIVTTRVGGIPEIIEDGREGFLVEAGDIETMAEKIALLARDPALCHKLGNQARKRANEQFDFQTYIDRLGSEIDRIWSR